MKRHSPQHGFVALISILIVASVLMATTVGLAQFGIANRYFVLNLEQKAASKKLAEGCIQIVRLQTYKDPNYEVSSPKTFTIRNGACTVISVTNSGNQTIAKATANSNGATTNLIATIITNNGEFLSVEEVVRF